MKKLAGNSLHESGCELTHFATRGELKEVTALLNSGLHANGIQNLQEQPTLVPLVAAARFGNSEMIKIILSHGGDPKRTEYPNKRTFLHAAAQLGKIQVNTMILKH